MDANPRVLTQLPLRELWRDDGFSTTARGKLLTNDVAGYSVLRIAGGRALRIPDLYAHLQRGLTTVAIAMNSKGQMKKIINGQAPAIIDRGRWISETEGCEAE